MKIIKAALLLLYASSTVDAAAAANNSTEGCFQGSPFHPDDWMHCQPINDRLFMYYTPLDDTVMLGLHATEGVSGWSSLGLAGNGGMKGASQIIVRQDDDGTWVAEDRYSHDYVTPSVDEQQDVQLLFAQQDDESGETAWGVVLPQNSCDEAGLDYEIQDRNMFMIWAYGQSHLFEYHGENHGQFTANLLGSPPKPTDFGDYQYMDFVMPNVEVVRGEKDQEPTNAYVCTYYDFDEIGQEMGVTAEDKVHVVGYEAKITEGNEKYLHHLALHSCGGTSGLRVEGFDFLPPFDDSSLYHGKVDQSCTSMPRGCLDYVAYWNVGGEPTPLPENVGIPMGEGKRWLVMQMHYYNPSLDENVYDSSGLRVYMTKDLRPVDAARMRFGVGMIPEQGNALLPGGKKDVAMETLFVEPECTNTWSEPINVIEVFHHSHYLGSHQEIVVERDGVNMGPMRKEYRFDYNHQSGVAPVDSLKTLMPGDRLAATCHFDTSTIATDSFVEIGDESYKEMCFPNLLYYPKQDMTDYGYISPEAGAKRFIDDYTWCFSPPADESFGNLCAEKLFTDIPGFFKQTFDEFGFSWPSMSASTVCNGGDLYAPIRERIPICPEDCVDDQKCSEEQLLASSQALCQDLCGQFGLSLYPDVSRTELYNTSNILCPTRLFDAPTLMKPQACQAKGSLPENITLTEVEEVVVAIEDDAIESSGSVNRIASIWNFALSIFVLTCVL